MKDDEAIRLIESEWDQPDGALGKLRMGIFDQDGLHRLLSLLKSIHIEDDSVVNRRLVSLLWYMPLFVAWQRERVVENGGAEEQFDWYENRILDAVVEILGYP